MGLKKVSVKDGGEKMKRMMSVEVKEEIIEKHECGVQVNSTNMQSEIKVVITETRRSGHGILPAPSSAGHVCILSGQLYHQYYDHRSQGDLQLTQHLHHLLSHPSDTLEIVVSGLSLGQRTCVQTVTLPKPTIWAEPGSVIPWNTSNVTIWCQGTLEAQEFQLYTEDMNMSLDRQKPADSGDKAEFFTKNIYAGRYYCTYLSSTGWSERSEPLELVMTGIHSKPSLSALPSPVVTSGGNVTLQCGSVQAFDSFVLTKEGEYNFSWTLDSHRHDNKMFRALFPLDLMNLSHNWTFRCYGYYNKNPQQWSYPSDPLDLLVSGSSAGPRPPTTGSISTAGGSDDKSLLHTQSGLQRGLPLYLVILIGVSVTLILLLSLLLFLLLLHQRQSKGRMSGVYSPEISGSMPGDNSHTAPADTAVKDPQSNEGVELDTQKNRHDEVSQAVTYAQVNLSSSRVRQGMSISTALSEGLVDTKDRQAEGNRQMDSQDVTYVQMNHRPLKQETTAPLSSPSEEPSDEPSVYATLLVH
ncbi:leukocyte immunoglobulin-like receptor subfamily B member 4 [Rhynchonycteris naso]